MKLHNPIKGAISMLAAVTSFAFINVITQYLGVIQHVSSSTIALFQYSIALVFILPYAISLGWLKTITSEHIWWHILRVLLAVLGVQFWIAALSYPVPIWQAISLLMTGPLFTCLGAKILLKETLSIHRIFAILTGFIGALVILQPWSDSFMLASLLPIFAAFCWSCCSLMVKKLSRYDSVATIMLYFLVLSLPFNMLFAYNAFTIFFNSTVWWLFLLMGLLTALAQYALIHAYSIADASFIQPFDNLKLPINVLASWLVFHTMPPGSLWLGALFIISSVFFITHYESKKYKKSLLSTS
jgi:drug/metabolite transporter (DMT)-like permease